MAIKHKTRKELWALSGNRCAICMVELIRYISDTNTNLNIGQECHIHSKRIDGPRHRMIYIDYDHYDNLILLCCNHHTMIDTQPDTYTAEGLQFLKIVHEKKIKEILNLFDTQPSNDLTFDSISRITSGKELVDIINLVHGYQFDYDEAQTDDEASAIAIFFENLENYGCLAVIDDIDKSSQVQLGLDFKHSITRLEDIGFLVFGERRKQNMQVDGKDVGMLDVALVYVIRTTNPRIIDLNLD